MKFRSPIQRFIKKRQTVKKKTVQGQVKAVKFTPWNAYAGTEVTRSYISNPFSTLSLEGDGWSATWHGRFTPWVGHGAGLDGHEKRSLNRDSIFGSSSP